MTGSSQIASKEQISTNRMASLIMSVIRHRLIIYDQHKRPSSEIDAIDQIVFRLKEVQSGDVVLNTTRRMCSVALLDARVIIYRWFQKTRLSKLFDFHYNHYQMIILGQRRQLICWQSWLIEPWAWICSIAIVDIDTGQWSGMGSGKGRVILLSDRFRKWKSFLYCRDFTVMVKQWSMITLLESG